MDSVWVEINDFPCCYFLNLQVLILSEKLHSVTSRFDHLRAIRFQDTINKATPRRKLNRVVKQSSADTIKPDSSELKEFDEIQPQSVSVQQQLMDDETRALQVSNFSTNSTLSIKQFPNDITCFVPISQVELTSLLDAVQQTETKMVEMSALNHLMSTHILQQAQQIEHLYDQVSIL